MIRFKDTFKWTLWCILLLLSTKLLKGQAPTDNPYVGLNAASENHWTQEIKWGNVTNALTVPQLIRSQTVDAAVLQSTIKAISDDGGGVLFFPKGSYQFQEDIQLETGVVLRGESNTVKRDAHSEEFDPLTDFVFPKYNFNKKIYRGTPDHTSFKRITHKAEGLKNCGLVDLDINRAVIHLNSNEYEMKRYKKDTLFNPVEMHQNIILMGLRLNNAAVPDPEIPTRYQREKGYAWQRWPWKMGANIDVTVSENCIVTNCRLNDDPSDNFRQDGYLIDDGMTFDGFESMFSFEAHIGINVNGYKTNMTYDAGKLKAGKVFKYIDQEKAKKKTEPLLFSEGIIIRDNFVRVARNQPIVTFAKGAIQENNKIDTTVYQTCSVKDGREAVWDVYKLVYHNDTITEPHVYVNNNLDSLPYRLMVPENYNQETKYPLILFLHGFGERGVDNREHIKHFLWQFVVDGRRQEYPCFILAPQRPANDFSWLEEDKPSTAWVNESTFEVMDLLSEKYNIDTNRIYIVGVSIGGNALWQYVGENPYKFAAAVPIASFVKITKEFAERIKHVPVWAFNGAEDEQLPEVFTRLWVGNLKRAGGKPKLTQFEKTGHICWNKIYYEAEFLPWLFSQNSANYSELPLPESN